MVRFHTDMMAICILMKVFEFESDCVHLSLEMCITGLTVCEKLGGIADGLSIL